MLEALRGQAGAVARAPHGFLHLFAVNGLLTGLAGDKGRLAGDVGNAPEACGHLAPARGDAGAVLGHGGHPGCGKRQQLLVPSEARQHPGVLLHAFVRALDLGIEIRQHLEQVRKILVYLVQLVVEAAAAQQDDPHGDVDGLRLQRLRAERPGQVGGDDFHRPRAQGAHQRAPGAGLGQHVVGIQHQVAAVGAQQRAGADAAVVGDDLAAGHEVRFHRAQQVGHGGGVLGNHRAGLGVFETRDHVDAVDLGGGRQVVGLLARHAVLHHVVDDLIEETGDGRVAKAGADGLGQGLEYCPDFLLGELARRLHPGLPGRPCLGGHRLQLLAELADALFRGLGRRLIDRAFAAQLAVVVRRHRFTIDHGKDGRPGDGAGLQLHQGQPVGAQLLLERLGDGGDGLLGLFLDGVTPRLGRRRIQHLAQAVVDELRDIPHQAPEPGAFARVEGDQAWPVRLGEIVHVATVQAPAWLGIQLRQHRLHQGHAPRAGHTAHVNVLARGVAFHAEAHGLDGHRLPDDAPRRVDVARGFEVESSCVVTPAQFVSVQAGRVIQGAAPGSAMEGGL